MSNTVDVSTEGMGDLSRALTKKRLDCVKLNETLHAPPRGLSDLMAQSRAFTDKLTHLLEDGSELSDAIKNELTDDNGFPGQVHRMPLEGAYDDIERVKEELRISDGYQPYIVAPENGLRKLFENSMQKLANPVRDLVDTVHGIVVMAAEKAMHEACQVPSVERGPPVVRFPRFQENILPVAEEGLDELKDDAMKTALKIVEMEKDFVSCSFFRYLTYKRIHEQEDAQKRRDQEGMRRKGRRGEDDDEDDEDDEYDDDGVASVTETEGRSGGGGGRGGVYIEDYAELTEGHGLGSAIFWDPICRDQNNGLLPSPGVFIDGDADLSMERALIQHAADMKTYTRLACETLVMTVPKVIVHCLVDKSTEKLGPIIEEHILRLPEDTRELLLEEDVSIAAHRQRVRETINEIGKAQDTLKEAERSMGASPTAKVEISTIELAGLSARLKKNEEGVYVFINKPKPPNAKRTNVTPERRRETASSTAAAPAPPPAQPQRQPYQGHPTAPPAVGAHGPGSRASNGSNQPAPRRPAPPVAVASNRAATAAANGAPNGTPASSNAQQQQPSTHANKSQQPKQPQSSTWYGFKPFGR